MSKSSSKTKLLVAVLLVSFLLVLGAAIVACTSKPVQTPTLNQSTVVAQSLDQTSFKVAGLTISPAKANKGEPISILANVVNTGESEGTFKAELGINNVVAASKMLTIPAGVAQALNFVVTKDKPGTYEVTIGGVKGQFIVGNQDNVVQTNSTTTVSGSGTTSSSCCGPAVTTSSSSSSSSCCGTPPAQQYPTQYNTKKSGGCCGN